MVVGQQNSQSGQEALLAFLSRSVLFGGWPVGDLFTADPQKAANPCFIMVIASIFIGAMTSAREITKESAIYIRERLVNLKILPYGASKVMVLGSLSFIQAAVFLGLVSLRIKFPDLDAQLGLKLFANMYLVCLAGMSMGLMISAFVPNEDRATGLVPLFVIPQMTLAGAIIPIANMPKAGQFLSNLAISRWGFENFGIITNHNDRLNALVAQRPGLTNDYQQAFEGSLRAHYGVLILFVVIFLTAATLLVKRKDVRCSSAAFTACLRPVARPIDPAPTVEGSS